MKSVSRFRANSKATVFQGGAGVVHTWTGDLNLSIPTPREDTDGAQLTMTR